MRRAFVFSVLTCILCAALYGQDTSKVDKSKLVQQAKPLYYSLVKKGLVSFSCEVKTDWDTLPKALLLPAEIAGRKPLEETRLKASMGNRGTVTITREYPRDAGDLIKPAYDKFFDWHSSVIRGFLMVWEKSLDGMIPNQEAVLDAKFTSNGYEIEINPPGSKITLGTDKSFIINLIQTTTGEDTAEERPTFTPSPEGLLFTANDVINTSGMEKTHIQFSLDYQQVEGLRIPHRVHLIVNDYMDEKFAFENCTAVRGVVLKVSPPPS